MMKISSQNLKRISLVNYSRRYFSASHLDSIKIRDQEILSKVMNSDSYSASEFSNFLRIVNNNKDNNTHQGLLDRFSNELPKHVNFLDDLDTRKVISILLANPSVQNHLPLVKERFGEIKKVKGIRHEDGTVKIGSNMKRLPMSIRFWVGYAKLRERLYMKIRNTKEIDLH